MKTDAAKSQFDHAQKLFKSGQLDEASVLLAKLTQQFPDDKNLLFAQARCLAKLGHVDEARAIYQDLVTRFDHARARQLLEELKQFQSSNSGLTRLGDLLDLVEEEPSAAPKKFELSTKDKMLAFFMHRWIIIIIVGLAVIIGVYLWQLKLLDNRNWGGIDLDDTEMNRPATTQPEPGN